MKFFLKHRTISHFQHANMKIFLLHQVAVKQHLFMQFPLRA